MRLLVNIFIPPANSCWTIFSVIAWGSHCSIIPLILDPALPHCTIQASALNLPHHSDLYFFIEINAKCYFRKRKKQKQRENNLEQRIKALCFNSFDNVYLWEWAKSNFIDSDDRSRWSICGIRGIDSGSDSQPSPRLNGKIQNQLFILFFCPFL